MRSRSSTSPDARAGHRPVAGSRLLRRRAVTDVWSGQSRGRTPTVSPNCYRPRLSLLRCGVGSSSLPSAAPAPAAQSSEAEDPGDAVRRRRSSTRAPAAPAGWRWAASLVRGGTVQDVEVARAGTYTLTIGYAATTNAPARQRERRSRAADRLLPPHRRLGHRQRVSHPHQPARRHEHHHLLTHAGRGTFPGHRHSRRIWTESQFARAPPCEPPQAGMQGNIGGEDRGSISRCSPMPPELSSHDRPGSISPTFPRPSRALW